MKPSKTTQALLSAALISLGSPAVAEQTVDSSVPVNAQTKQLTVEQLRALVNELFDEMKSNPQLAESFRLDPGRVLSARGIPTCLLEDLTRELNTDETSSNLCQITCLVTCLVC